MPAKFVPVDRTTPLLMPPTLQEWVRDDDMVHFVIEAVEGLTLKGLKTNDRGSGKAQYPPRMMVALLIYCYTQGLFSSRKIEHATYDKVSVRYLTGDTHPDHDTVATFRRKNLGLFTECFKEVLVLATELGVLKVGRVSVDGTLVRANASMDKNLTPERAAEIEQQLDLDIAELLERAEEADRQEEADGDSLPESLASRQKLKAKIARVKEEAARRAAQRHAEEKSDYEERMERREAKARREGRKPRGRKPKPPPEEPEIRGDEQINLTDRDSRVMKKSKRSGFEQSYNAQAVVSNESMLVVGQRVGQSSSDQGELVADIESVPAELGAPDEVLADSGYGNEAAVAELEGRGMDLYVSVCGESQHRNRSYDYRPRKAKKSAEPKAPWRVKMKRKLEEKEGREIYGERFHTVEPVFGVIKAAMGFRMFSMRGIEKVSAEWELVCTAYNLKRLFGLTRA